jgi:hypothetical protein
MYHSTSSRSGYCACRCANWPTPRRLPQRAAHLRRVSGRPRSQSFRIFAAALYGDLRPAKLVAPDTTAHRSTLLALLAQAALSLPHARDQLLRVSGRQQSADLLQSPPDPLCHRISHSPPNATNRSLITQTGCPRQRGKSKATLLRGKSPQVSDGQERAQARCASACLASDAGIAAHAPQAINSIHTP